MFLINWRLSIHSINIRHLNLIALYDLESIINVVVKKRFKTEDNINMVKTELLLGIELKN